MTFQGGVPVNARTCKHLKSLLGDKYEAARLKLKNPHGPPSKGAAKKPASKTGKRKKAGDDDDDDDVQPTKRSRKPASSSKGKSKDADDVKPASKSRKPNSTSTRKVKEEDDEEEDEAASEDADDESAPVTKNVPELLLANKWDLDTGLDPVGWWISEKLDGVRFVDSFSRRCVRRNLHFPRFRTYYDGTQMISRLGNPFTPPKWFLDSEYLDPRSILAPNISLAELPKDITLDGELFGGRGEFQSTVSIVKTVNSPHWKGITFQVCLDDPLAIFYHFNNSNALQTTDFRYTLARQRCI